METSLVVFGELIFVGVVYYFAYKNGYKTGQAKVASTVQQFSGSVNDLLDRLTQAVDQSLGKGRKGGS